MNQSILNQRYKLNKRISRKGARHTFLATDLTTQELVVVKVLLFGADFQWQEYKLFERGSQTLQHLDHPHIPRYLDYFDVTLEKAQGFAQVQRYIEAPSIQEHIDRGRSFSETEINQIARQLLEILLYLQQLHPPILHRDIKPSNILLGERSGNSVGQVYLVDFDSVKSHSTTPAGQTMTIVGTYGYMAPEQFGGKAYPGSDLYGLAATLVAIASGKAPSDLPQKEFRIDFEAEVNLSPHLVSWLKWLLEPSLDSRAKSASEALAALDNSDRLPFTFKLSKVEAKPAGSRIKIKQNAEFFKVVLPTQHIITWEKSQSKIVLIFFALFLLGPLLIFLLLFYIGYKKLTSTHLVIKPNEITFCKKLLFIFTFQGFDKFPRNAINKIKISEKKVLMYTYQTVGRNEKIIRKQLTLPTASEIEADWLAQELSSFLKIPIDR